MYIYSYLFCLYRCKDCCHRVTTQLQLEVIVIIIKIIIINKLRHVFQLRIYFLNFIKEIKLRNVT